MDDLGEAGPSRRPTEGPPTVSAPYSSNNPGSTISDEDLRSAAVWPRSFIARHGRALQSLFPFRVADNNTEAVARFRESLRSLVPSAPPLSAGSSQEDLSHLGAVGGPSSSRSEPELPPLHDPSGSLGSLDRLHLNEASSSNTTRRQDGRPSSSVSSRVRKGLTKGASLAYILQ